EYRIPRPEDLIIMKAVAGRPRDWEDIRRVAELHPRLDRKRIRKLVGKFAAVLGRPGLRKTLDRALGSPVDRLALFDAATARQRRRTARSSRHPKPASRGWRREDLY